MFSINRFDPSNQTHHQKTNQPLSFNPLSRLTARLEASKGQPETNQDDQVEGQTERKQVEVLIEKSDSKLKSKPKSESIEIEDFQRRDQELDNRTDSITHHPSTSQPITKKQKERIQLGFTGANSIPLTTLAADPKPKTTAKLKYLKRKKERSKLRKRSRSDQSKNLTSTQPESVQAPSEQTKISVNDDSLSNQIPISNTEVAQSLVENQPEGFEKKLKRSNRPKNLDVVLETISKKRKKPDLSSDKKAKDDQELEKPQENEKELEEAQNDDFIIEKISQPGVLPRFPAPVNPSLPDPQLLARLAMGLGDLDSDVNDEDQDMIQFDHQSSLELSKIGIRTGSGEFVDTLTLRPHSISRLKKLGFESLLAVQIAVFSILMPPLSAYSDTPASSFYPEQRPPRDLCVSAPTGSGKTLSYIVPIVETLSTRLVCRLRALIVLPTRDLVLQVKNTFDCFSKGSGLKAAIITGQHSFNREQALIGCSSEGSEDAVDVVIATPGRLIDHLNYTPGFSLQHLCFLVLDEADQLLNKSQTWLHQVLSTTTRISKAVEPKKNDELQGWFSFENQTESTALPSCNNYPSSPMFSGMNAEDVCDDSWQVPIERYNPCRLRPFRILLFSATLRRDPVKLAHLGLRKPVFIKISSGSKATDFVDELNEYTLPKTLQQHITVTTTNLKPLVFFKLIKSKEITKALCFCKSIEGANRLTSLCKLMMEQLKLQPPSAEASQSTATNDDNDECLLKAECFSSDLSPSQRKTILNRFQNGEINILICSDMIARGIDIPGVKNVINYDSPIDIKKYIHRVGRTARVNQDGRSWTLMESQEAKFVKKFLKDGLGSQVWKDQVKKIRLNWLDLQDVLTPYNVAVKKLGEMYAKSINL